LQIEADPKQKPPQSECEDWESFVARFYPNTRRHDFNVLAAYESYRNDSSVRDSDWSASAEETGRWESEGGAVAERLRRARRRDRRVGTRTV
jgi:hypothetical protein